MKILVIEDDKKTADFLLKALKESGYTTIYAADGRTGLMTAKTETFDLVIIQDRLAFVPGEYRHALLNCVSYADRRNLFLAALSVGRLARNKVVVYFGIV